MKQGIGFSVTINIIAVFIVVTFAFLVTSLNYYKAYKVNNVIAASLEKYSGYNRLSSEEIDRKLTSLGYIGGSSRCQHKNGKELVTKLSNKHNFCLYKEYIYSKNKEGNNIKTKDFKYLIITYINFNIPIINQVINLPVTSHTGVIVDFSS